LHATSLYSEGFKERLSKHLEVPVETLDPFRRIKYSERHFSRVRLQALAPDMALAVGLALRATESPLININLAESSDEQKRVRPLKTVGRRKIFLFPGRERPDDVVITAGLLLLMYSSGK
jgi:hypothetical protein